METTFDIETALHNYSRELAGSALKQYEKQITPVLYLYGLKSKDEPFDDRSQFGSYTELRLSRDRVRYFDLVLCEHIPRNLDVESLQDWFLFRLRREPIIPVLERD